VAKQTHEPGTGPGPGPGRSTADAAFIALKKEIAERNDEAQKEARKVRATREQEQARRRRHDDLR
jgi:hypothetical protein